MQMIMYIFGKRNGVSVERTKRFHDAFIKMHSRR